MGLKFGDWLRAERKKSRLSQTEFGNLVGVGKTSISNWERGAQYETGRVMLPGLPQIEQIVRVLQSHHVDVTIEDALAAYRNEQPTGDVSPRRCNFVDFLRRYGRILPGAPVIGDVPAAAAPDRRYEEDRGDIVEAAGADYVLRVDGDSMEPFLRDGQIIFVRQTHTAPIGKIVIALVDGDSICKRLTGVRYDPDTGDVFYTLSPENHKYREILAANIEIQGYVVGRIESV